MLYLFTLQELAYYLATEAAGRHDSLRGGAHGKSGNRRQHDIVCTLRRVRHFVLETLDYQPVALILTLRMLMSCLELKDAANMEDPSQTCGGKALQRVESVRKTPDGVVFVPQPSDDPHDPLVSVL